MTEPEEDMHGEPRLTYAPTPKVESVNRALAEIGAVARRLAFLEQLRVGEDDLGDPEVMKGAWL